MGDYQRRVAEFVIACFGRAIASDTVERNHRFLEEALELVQALGCTAAEAHMLVDYVFGRPIGNSHQECGGVMVTLAALATAAAIDMEQAGEDELARVWKNIDEIREKQKRKPRGSPLPSSQGVTPHSTAMDNSIDSNDARAWRTLAYKLEHALNAEREARPAAMFDTVQLSEARYYRNSKDPIGILARAILRANGEMK